MLIVDSELARSRPLTTTSRNQLWDYFCRKGSSNHSAGAGTLPFIINRCEQEKIAYQLIAIPSAGYFIKRLNVAEAMDHIGRLRP